MFILRIDNSFLFFKIVHFSRDNSQRHGPCIFHNIFFFWWVIQGPTCLEFLVGETLWLRLNLRPLKSFFLNKHLLNGLLFLELLLSKRFSLWDAPFHYSLFPLLFLPCFLHSFKLFLCIYCLAITAAHDRNLLILLSD